MGEGRRALGRDRCVLANRVAGRTSARGDEKSVRRRASRSARPGIGKINFSFLIFS